MASTITLDTNSVRSARLFGAVAVATILGSCLLAGWLPIGFSIVIVFLFAGPHNWVEARYMMTRMPARWGKLRNYFLLGLLGVPLLTALSASLPYGMRSWDASPTIWLSGIATWNSLMTLWIATLAHMRCQQNPRRDWPWLWPVCFMVIAVNWLWPLAWSIGLVYLHPLIALWFLDRELAKRNSQWRSVFHRCVALIPVLMGVLWWRLAGQPNLPGEGILSMQITNHSGGHVFENISTHFLVSAHTFLEMIHYGVWLIAIPLVSRSVSVKLQNVPLAKRSIAWHRTMTSVLAFGAFLMLVLWVGFLLDYSTTRDIYFTVATMHVLAEVPFLLRLL